MDQNLKAAAIFAAQSAGKILMDHFGKITEMDIVKNRRRDFTTKVDLEAERAIIKILKKKTPTYNIVAEETGAERHRSPFTWIIDPLDGTTNYSIGNPFFDVSIALVKERTPILAVVYAPVIDWLFIAQKGYGTTLNNHKIHVSDKNNLSKSLNTYCHGQEETHIKRLNKIFPSLKLKSKDFSRMRAAAYELALVSCGKIDSYISPGVKSWDIAAGALLIKEAGGKVTDFEGKEWDIDSKDVIASNGKIHNHLILEINKSLEAKEKEVKKVIVRRKRRKKKNAAVMIKH